MGKRITIAQAHIEYEVIVDVSSDILVCICLHLFTDCCCCIQGRIYFYQEISINYITPTIYGLWFAACSSSSKSRWTSKAARYYRNDVGIKLRAKQPSRIVSFSLFVRPRKGPPCILHRLSIVQNADGCG
jgi:hypothetical protein